MVLLVHNGQRWSVRLREAIGWTWRRRGWGGELRLAPLYQAVPLFTKDILGKGMSRMSILAHEFT